MLGKEIQIARFFVFFHDLFLCKNPRPPRLRLNRNRLQNCALEHEPEPEQIANIKQEKNIEIEIQEYEQNFPFLPVDSHESKMPRDLNNLSQEDEYFCGFCIEKFNQIQNLRNHIKNAHHKSESFRFELSGFPCEMIVKS